MMSGLLLLGSSSMQTSPIFSRRFDRIFCICDSSVWSSEQPGSGARLKSQKRDGTEYKSHPHTHSKEDDDDDKDEEDERKKEIKKKRKKGNNRSTPRTLPS
jgi:hypothetical protein